MENKRLRVIVSGYVQGVGFRIHCQRQAQSLGVFGWVRNQWDGTVEAFFEGSADAVDAMVAWCRHGPPAAEVTSLVCDERPEEPPHRSFSVRF